MPSAIDLTDEHRGLLCEVVAEHGGQVLVAAAVGISQGTLSKILSGGKGPGPVVWLNLLHELELMHSLTDPVLKIWRVGKPTMRRRARNRTGPHDARPEGAAREHGRTPR